MARQMWLEAGDRTYRVHVEQGVDVSIPLDFHGAQPGAFQLPSASARAVEVGNFIGDMRRGGTCNCELLTFTPHGNGTHTECAGHVVPDRVPLGPIVPPPLLAATLVTIEPALTDGERVLTPGLVELSLDAMHEGFGEALVVRTLPNDAGKRRQSWSTTNPPYFSPAAARLLRKRGFEHLLVDLPSLDREDDGGRLAAHREFFGLPDLAPGAAMPRFTVTEMLYVDDAVPDGRYALSLQFPSFVMDAAPSRVLLYPVSLASMST
jgi:kynurenine formamidase